VGTPSSADVGLKDPVAVLHAQRFLEIRARIVETVPFLGAPLSETANWFRIFPHKFAKKNVDHRQPSQLWKGRKDAKLGLLRAVPTGNEMGRTSDAPPPTMIAPVFWAWAQEQAAPGEPLRITRRRAIQLQLQADADLAKAVHREAFLAIARVQRRHD